MKFGDLEVSSVLVASAFLLRSWHISHSKKIVWLTIIVELKNISTTLWLFNIAMENGPFIDGLPIKNGDFPLLC